MAKRATKKSPRRASKKPMPWLEVVERLRADTEDQQHRLKLLGSLWGWADFVAAWASVAQPILRHAYPLDRVYDGAETIDEMHYWAWTLIDETGAVDTALEFVNETAPLASLDVIQCFDTFRNAYLLYPDGAINAHVMQRVHDEAQAAQSAVSIRANARLVKDIQTAAYLGKLTRKHEHKLREDV